MRSAPSTILALLIASNALAASPPARNATGGAAPTPFSHATAEDAKDPNISQPKDPGVDCVAELTKEDEANARLQGKVKDPRKTCLPQHDAFKRAAEAASYLAIYQQHFSDYGIKMADKKKREEIQAAVKECLNGGPKCDDSLDGNRMRADLFQALVQYNFGKDVRAQMLEAQTRAENMKTLDLSTQELRERHWQGKRLLSWNGKLKSQPVRENTFRLDPKKVVVFDASKLSSDERAKLGVEFNQGFNAFVNEYTSSAGIRGPKSRWSYVAAKSTAVGGGKVWITQFDGRNLDTREGKAAVDKGRLERDIKTQDTRVVNEIVSSYREDFKDVLAKPTSDYAEIDRTKPDGKPENVTVDSMQRAYDLAGFGLSKAALRDAANSNGQLTPQEVAGQVVLDINKALNDTEKKMAEENRQNNARMPSSAPKGPAGVAEAKVVPSVTVDVAAFDKFLDDIWPTGAPKP